MSNDPYKLNPLDIFQSGVGYWLKHRVRFISTF